jgi:hypothetical protein
MRAWLQRTVWVLLSIVIPLMMAVPVHAQEDDDDAAEEPAKKPTDEELAAARELFNEAKDLESEGDWAKALDRLEKVAKVVVTPQVRFHIALCHENLGRLVEAINGYELAAQEAERTGAEEVIENAPPRAASLRKRVAHIVLEITGKVRVSKIFLDDRQVSLALAGTRIPVDPGSHRVEVRRDGEVTYEMDVELAEAEAHKLEIEIDDPKPEPTPDPSPNPKPGPDPIPKEPETEMKRLPAYILAGVGVASFITSGIFWGLRQTAVSNIADGCEDPGSLTGCDPDDRELEDVAQTYDVAAKVFVGVGAVSLASGVVLWFVLAPDDGSPTTGNKSKKVSVTPTLGGLMISGSF